MLKLTQYFETKIKCSVTQFDAYFPLLDLHAEVLQ